MSIQFQNELSPAFSMGISNAVVATVLALIVAMITWKSKWPAWTHALWVLVLVKLLIPPVFWIATGVPSPTNLQTSSELNAESSANPGQFMTVGETISGLSAEAPMPNQAEISSVDSGSMNIPWIGLLGLLWLFGAVWSLARTTLQTFAYRRWLMTASPAPSHIQLLTDQSADRINLKRRPKVLVVPNVITPSVFSIGTHTSLVLPSQLIDELNDEELSTILTHELVHLRRGDGWVRVLEVLTGAMFWWHPILPVVRRRIHESAEQACDAWVTSVLPNATDSYASAMLKTIDFLSGTATHKNRLSAPLLTGMGNIHSLAKRMRQISQANTPRTLTWRGRLGIFTAALMLLPLGLMTIPSLQAQQLKTTDKQAVEANPAVKKAAAEDLIAKIDPKGVEAALRKKLLQKTSLEVVDQPFDQVIASLASKCRVPIKIDKMALEEIGIAFDQEISVSIKNTSLKSLLRTALRDFGATYVIKNEAIHITTVEAAESSLAARLFPIPKSMLDKPNELVETVTQTIAPDFWDTLGGPGSITVVGDKLAVSATERVHDETAAFLDQFATKHTLRIQLNGDKAVISVSGSAPNKLLIAVITAVQASGIEKLSLNTHEPDTKLTNPQSGFVILADDQSATIRASKDVAAGTVQKIIKQLQSIGFEKFSLATL